MKRIYILFSLLVILTTQYSCKKNAVIDPGFKDQFRFSIYDYLVTNKADYSSFLQILQAGGLDKTLSAYNPGGITKGIDYTLFLPDNKAVDDFINASNGAYATLADLLQDKAYCEALSRYHILNKGVETSSFPFGTFDQPNLSNDYLNVNFDVQPDTTFYKINNVARVIKANIQTSNGFIQVIETMMKPITMNSYGWLKSHPDYSIYTAALEATGIDRIIDVDMKLKDQPLQPFTMLIEPDSIYKMRNINSFAELAQAISPGRTDYTDISNPLNLFVGYHILKGSYFLDKIASANTNYDTFADIPLTINGLGLDIVINKYKEIFVSANNDTTDFVGLNYDASNVNTQSGAIHFIDQILKPQIPSQADLFLGFWEEPQLTIYRQLTGTFLIENHNLLKNITWTGANLTFVQSVDPAEAAWDKDYLQIEGDFSITYNVPKMVQGKYDVALRAGADYADSQNPNKVSVYPVVEMYIDGIKIGGLIDLTTGGSATNPYVEYKVGSVDFKKYDGHAVTIKSLIPGRFVWDNLIFYTIKIYK